MNVMEIAVFEQRFLCWSIGVFLCCKVVFFFVLVNYRNIKKRYKI